jgi:hypothetical protein
MELVPNTALYCWEEELDTLYTDDMGRFPIRAQSGNQYVMLAYHAGANAILVEPFQTKADHHRIPAYNKSWRVSKPVTSKSNNKSWTMKPVKPTNL